MISRIDCLTDEEYEEINEMAAQTLIEYSDYHIPVMPRIAANALNIKIARFDLFGERFENLKEDGLLLNLRFH